MMAEPKVFQMGFAKVYGLLVSKAEKKGRTRAEVDTAARWLTCSPVRLCMTGTAVWPRQRNAFPSPIPAS